MLYNHRLYLVPNIFLIPKGNYSPKTGFASWWVSSQIHSQVKEQEKEGFITCSKEGEPWGSFPKQCFPGQQNWGSFKLRVHAYS